MCPLNKRRSRFELAREILRLALDGANAASIISMANLAPNSFAKQAGSLVARGLLVVDGKSDSPKEKIYKTTEKGRMLLDLLNEVTELL